MATSSIARRSFVAQALILMLGTAVFLNYVDRGAIGIAAPRMKDELGLSDEVYGLAFSAFFWIYAPVQLFAGWLCDRFSVYRLMALGISLWAASTLLMSNIARGAPKAQIGEDEPNAGFKDEPFDIPRFLNRQNNQ